MNDENISAEAGCRPSEDLTTGRCQLSRRVPQPGRLSIVGVSHYTLSPIKLILLFKSSVKSIEKA